MAQTGSFGPLIFEISPGRKTPIPSISAAGGGRWNAHEVAGAEPVQEWNGPAPRTACFTVVFATQHGVDAEAELERVAGLAEAGTSHPLIIGGKPHGGSGSYWAIESWSVESTVFTRSGSTARAEVQLSFIRIRSASSIARQQSAVQNTSTEVTVTRIGDVVITKKNTQKKR